MAEERKHKADNHSEVSAAKRFKTVSTALPEGDAAIIAFLLDEAHEWNYTRKIGPVRFAVTDGSNVLSFNRSGLLEADVDQTGYFEALVVSDQIDAHSNDGFVKINAGDRIYRSFLPKPNVLYRVRVHGLLTNHPNDHGKMRWKAYVMGGWVSPFEASVYRTKSVYASAIQSATDKLTSAKMDAAAQAEIQATLAALPPIAPHYLAFEALRKAGSGKGTISVIPEPPKPFF